MLGCERQCLVSGYRIAIVLVMVGLCRKPSIRCGEIEHQIVVTPSDAARGGQRAASLRRAANVFSTCLAGSSEV